MKVYFDTVLKHCVDEMENNNPIYFTRYEDMVKDMTGPTKGIMTYLLDLDDIAGTNAERRVDQFMAKKKENPNVDRPY